MRLLWVSIVEVGISWLSNCLFCTAVRKAAGWADANLDISRTTSLVAIVDEFASRLFAELDYIQVPILITRKGLSKLRIAGTMHWK